MATLEQKIRALMESHNAVSEEELVEGTSEAAVALRSAANGLEAAADALSDGKSEDDGDEDEDDEKQTATAKDVPEVKENTDPFGSLAAHGDEGETGATKTGKLKAGLSKKDSAPGKLETPPSTGKQDDEGKNAKLKVGMKNSDKSGGKLDALPGAVGGDNEFNAKSVAGTDVQKGSKKGVVEHMTALFQGEELSEEFQSKAATIFEAAVEQVAAQRIAELEEEFQNRLDEDAQEVVSRLDEAVEVAKQELVEQVNGFLNRIVEQWVDDNAIALEGAMKVELVNSFIDGMKGLFKEHYFEVPDDKLDIVEEQANEINQLKEVLQELVDSHDELILEKVEMTKSAMIESVTTTLTDIEKEKFAQLVENIKFTTEDEYVEKLDTIKESYFPKGKGGQLIPDMDTPLELNEEVHARVDSYVDSIAKRIKF